MSVRHRPVTPDPQDDGCLKCGACPLPESHDGECTCPCAEARTFWRAEDLTKVPRDEPLFVSLMRYRLKEDRQEVPSQKEANLVSSRTRAGTHVPIVDLDFPHSYVPSSTPGHAHLYLNVPISKWRWWVLMVGLRVGRVIEKGTFVWSLRRGGNFFRLPRVKKYEPENPVSYGWVFPKKNSDG